MAIPDRERIEEVWGVSLDISDRMLDDQKICNTLMQQERAMSMVLLERGFCNIFDSEGTPYARVTIDRNRSILRVIGVN